MIKRVCIILIVLLGSSFNARSPKNDCLIVLEKSIQAVHKVHTARYKLHAAERVNDKLLTADSYIVIQQEPRKIYFKNHKGIEVLYIQGQNKGDCFVNPNAFPFVTLSLDPMKSIMRNNQHHTILDLGFELIGKVIHNAIKKSGSNFHRYFTLIGSVQHNGRDCYKIFGEYPDFAWVTYTAQKGETLRTIAEKLGVGEYRIRQKNQGIGLNEKVKEGRVLKVPNIYASKTILYIDKELMLPVYIKVFDDEGLYEYYDFSEMEINHPLSPDAFNKDNPAYNF